MNQFSHLMSGQKKYIATIVVAVALAFVTLNCWSSWSNLRLFGPFLLSENVEKSVTAQSGTAVAMPVSLSGPSFRRYLLTGQLRISLYSPRTFTVVPDDLLEEMTINGVDVDLSLIPKDLLSDFSHGFVIDLSKYLKVGLNDVSFQFQNFRGKGGISSKVYLGNWITIIVGVLWASLVFWVCLIVLRARGISWLHSSLYLLVFFGAVIQVAYIVGYNPVFHIGSDAQRHWEQGVDALRLDLMSMTDPIVYQLYIGVLGKLTLKNPALVAFYTSLLALSGPWLWYRFLRELQSNKSLALFGWAIFSLLPSWTSIYGYFMQETLLIPLLGAAMWASWRCRRKADLSSFLIMVVLWVLAGLTRGIAIPMAAVVCTWLWFVQEERLRKAIYSSLVLLVIMGPLTYRSYIAVNQFSPHGMSHLVGIYARSGNKTIELSVERNGSKWGYWFGSPSTGAKPFEPFSDWKTRRAGSVKVDVDLMKGREDWDRALEQVEVPFDKHLWLVKENLIFLFFGPSWPDNNPQRFVDVANIVLRFVWAPLFVLVILCLFAYRRKLKGQWMLPSVIGIWFFVQGLTLLSLNEGRYRKPFEGLVVCQLLLIIAAVKGQGRIPAPSPSWDRLVGRVWPRDQNAVERFTT